SLAITGISSSTLYYLQVVSVNPLGAGYAADLQLAEDPVDTVPLKWNAVSGADSYTVYRSLDGTTWTAIGETTGTTFTDTDVQSDTSYQYYVSSTTDGLESQASSPI